MQFDQSVGIFDCNKFTVYSNVEIDIGPGVLTHHVDSDLHCEYGGPWHNALNTPIFFVVWDKVLSEGTYKSCAWTVKTDPDCVFIPVRLRPVLREVSIAEGGTYINNCKYGMHGPMEVLSSRAVEVWVSGKEQCADHFNSKCKEEECPWGEDYFADECLRQVWNVNRIDNFQIMLEEACSPPKHWDSCSDGTAAAFHPFKDEESYMNCMLATNIRTTAGSWCLKVREGYNAVFGTISDPEGLPIARTARDCQISCSASSCSVWTWTGDSSENGAWPRRCIIWSKKEAQDFGRLHPSSWVQHGSSVSGLCKPQISSTSFEPAGHLVSAEKLQQLLHQQV